MVKLLVIRHGETDSNKNNVIMGHSDVPLNARGKKQAKLCGSHLLETKTKISSFYSSTLLRAIETTEIIKQELNFVDKIHYTSDLTERSFGNFEGKTYMEVRNQLNNKNGKWDITVKPPNGESGLEFYSRVKNGINKILNEKNWEKDDQIVLLTHGGTIRHLLAYLVCEKNAEYNDFPIDPKNCSLSLVNIDKEGEIGTRIIYLNYYQYLQ